MLLRAGLLALIAIAATASTAMADCRIIAFRFFPPHNDSVSTTGVSTGGSACTTRLRSIATLQMTSSSIVSRPSNGTLSQTGAMGFRYAPRAGFKGVDRYAIKVCGRGGGGSGCSTLSYNITVQ